MGKLFFRVRPKTRGAFLLKSAWHEKETAGLLTANRPLIKAGYNAVYAHQLLKRIGDMFTDTIGNSKANVSSTVIPFAAYTVTFD